MPGIRIIDDPPNLSSSSSDSDDDLDFEGNIAVNDFAFLNL
ncbi:hypothetical protein WN943_013063 [Citrus x changshan-huyou]